MDRRKDLTEEIQYLPQFRSAWVHNDAKAPSVLIDEVLEQEQKVIAKSE